MCSKIFALSLRGGVKPRRSNPIFGLPRSRRSLAMTFILLFAAVFSLCFASGSSFAGEFKYPRYSNYVNDYAKIISPQNEDSLNYYLKELNKKTGAQVAVVTLKSLEGESVEDVALNIGRTWGVGQKGKDNGIVILVSTGDRKMRIEVGYGLEGAIPDGKAGRIRDEYMLPFFKEGKMEQGIINGTLAVTQAIAEEYRVQMPAKLNSMISKPAKTYSKRHKKRTSTADIIFFIIFIIIFLSSPRRGLFIGGYTHYGGGFGGSSGGGFGGFGGGSFGGGGASGGW